MDLKSIKWKKAAILVKIFGPGKVNDSKISKNFHYIFQAFKILTLLSPPWSKPTRLESTPVRILVVATTHKGEKRIFSELQSRKTQKIPNPLFSPCARIQDHAKNTKENINVSIKSWEIFYMHHMEERNKHYKRKRKKKEKTHRYNDLLSSQ